MYTQEIICPACGKKTIVNVIDVAGKCLTPCQSCKRRIVVKTDKEGKVISIRQY